MRVLSGWVMGALMASASLLVVSGCGTAEAPTEPVAPIRTVPSMSAGPGGAHVTPAPVMPVEEAPAPVVVAAPSTATPAPSAAVQTPSTVGTVYPGTWLGLCTKLSDCDCSQWAEPTACETELSAGYESGLAQAESMGLPKEMLDQARMSSEKLAEISNEACPTICSAAAQFNAATQGTATP
jgi:hypothetical protein